VSIQERDDIEYVCIYPPFEGDCGEGFRVGFGGVTAIKIAKRHGPMDWLPYVEVWQADHLHAEAAQHQCSFIRFMDAANA
jgi:hypothetical protein